MAQTIREMWRRNLGFNVALVNNEEYVQLIRRAERGSDPGKIFDFYRQAVELRDPTY